MNETTNCRTKLLIDEPADKDAFGSHEKIADALVAMISKESGGFTVGVEGVWGSGKSTVVKILRNKLATHKDTSLITFDAWIHEGDPLRRSFLERVIRLLMQRDWVARKKWSNTLKRLAKRKNSVTRINTPTLTGEGVLFSISLLFVPLGVALLEGGVEAIGRPDIRPDFIIISGSICVLLPILLVPIMVLRACIDGRPWTSYLRLIANQIVEKERSTSFADPEPTSVEFVDHFSSLMAEALTPENRRAVLVIDNLDRVPEHVARSVWSALRAFLEASDSAKPGWFKRLWIVVPYARESLQGKLATEQNDNDSFASFIDKVFQARFYLSTPVLSDWKTHLFALLHEAFPDHDQNSGEFHKIYNVVNLRTPGTQNPTPRELLLVVNDIGALHRQWQDQFQLSHMAYYALLRRGGENIFQSLTSGSRPTPTEADLLGQNLADTTAALYFNCDPKDARQILLRRPLESLLSKGDGKGLSEFASQHSSIYVTLESVLPSILQSWLASAPNNIALAAVCLLKGDALKDVRGGERDSIENQLRWHALQVQRWQPTQEICEGVTLLLKLRPDNDLVEKLQKGITNGIELIPPAGAQMTDARRAQQLVPYIGFLKEVNRQGYWSFIKDTKVIPGAAAEWIVAAQILHDGDADKDLSLVMPLNCSVDDISVALTTTITAGQEEINHVMVIRLAKLRGEMLQLNNIAGAIQTRLTSATELPAKEVGILSHLFLVSAWASTTELEPIASAAKKGFLIHHFFKTSRNSEFPSAAYAFLAIMKANPTLAVQGGWQNSSNGLADIRNFLNNPDSNSKLLDAISDIIYRDDPEVGINLLITLWTAAAETRGLIRRCLRRLANKDGLRGKVSPKQIFDLWEGIDEEDQRANQDPALLSETLAAINGSGAMRDLLMSQQFATGQARLLIAELSSHDTVDVGFIKWIETALEQIPQDQWSTNLESGGALQRLVLVIAKKGASITLGVSYLDALVGYAAKMARGNLTNRYTAQDWGALLAALSGSLLIRFKQRVVDDLIELRGKINEQIFDALGASLVDIGVLSSNDEVVSNLFNVLMEQRHIKGLNWLSQVFEANGGGLNGFKNNDSIVEFRMRIEEALRSPGNSDADAAIRNLSKHWTKDGPKA